MGSEICGGFHYKILKMPEQPQRLPSTVATIVNFLYYPRQIPRSELCVSRTWQQGENAEFKGPRSRAAVEQLVTMATSSRHDLRGECRSGSDWNLLLFSGCKCGIKARTDAHGIKYTLSHLFDILQGYHDVMWPARSAVLGSLRIHSGIYGIL